jgi:acetyl coenzyme A synthetase (ADP forming)-like protein
VPVAGFDVVLRNGTTLYVRDAAPADRQPLTAFFAGLSAASLYSRFFQIKKSHADDVEALVGGDRTGNHTLVGETGGRIVAVAAWTIDAARPDRADVAFAVADDVQGIGVGTAMLEALADLGRRRGLKWFDADVLADNTRMMRVFVDSGFRLRQALDGGVYHVTLALDDSADHQLRAAGRAMAAAAASIRPFLEPRSVAVIGANRERGRIGSELLHNVVATGYTGAVHVVHPSANTIDGLGAVPRILDVPDAIDLAVIAVPAAQVLPVVDECLQKKVKALVVISAGFGETDGQGAARERALLDKVRTAGIRLVGPNCLGVLNTDPAIRLNATFSAVFPPAGNVAMSSQSGALGLAILDWARRLNIGLSTFVSVGNKADVSGNDLIQYWAGDPRTDVILLYLESFGNPRKFSQIARRVAREKPIVAVKSGRSQAGARAAASHTGALVSDDAIVDALFRQCGVIRTATMEEMFDVAAVLANQPVPNGPCVAILTNAGGPGILAADACEAQGLELRPLTDATRTALGAILPAAASIGNPTDMIASASADQYERALAAMLADEHVDSALAIFIPPLVTKGADVARAIARAAATAPHKPVLAVFLSSEPAGPLLAPIPAFAFPEAACAALGRATAYGVWRREPEGVPVAFADLDASGARRIVETVLERGGGWSAPDEAFALIGAAGIASVPGRLVESEDEAVAAADAFGYPVVLKAAGPRIVHKSELGAVRVGLADNDAVRATWRDLADALGDAMTGCLVQPMVSGGVEMLVGAIQDSMFGGVIACATGGVLTEVLADRQVRVVPLTDRDADAMVKGLRGATLLRGYRGQPAMDEGALRETVLRLSTLAELCPEVVELEINPLRVLPQGAVALDVRARIAPLPPPPATRRVRY